MFIMEEKPHIRSVIAKNVKKYRKLNNLTQEALAEAAEVSNTYIANIECGQTWISDKTLEKIASALRIDEYLLFIPEKTDSADLKTVEKKQELLGYLSKRQNELNNYVKAFFSDTFEYIMKKNDKH